MVLSRIRAGLARIFRSPAAEQDAQIEAIRRMTAKMAAETEESARIKAERQEHFEKYALGEVRGVVEGMMRYNQNRLECEKQVTEIVEELGRLADRRLQSEMDQQRAMMSHMAEKTGSGLADALEQSAAAGLAGATPGKGGGGKAEGKPGKDGGGEQP